MFEVHREVVTADLITPFLETFDRESELTGIQLFCCVPQGRQIYDYTPFDVNYDFDHMGKILIDLLDATFGSSVGLSNVYNYPSGDVENSDLLSNHDGGAVLLSLRGDFEVLCISAVKRLIRTKSESELIRLTAGDLVIMGPQVAYTIINGVTQTDEKPVIVASS